MAKRVFKRVGWGGGGASWRKRKCLLGIVVSHCFLFSRTTRPRMQFHTSGSLVTVSKPWSPCLERGAQVRREDRPAGVMV